MSSPSIRYGEQTASCEDIRDHLLACDGQFIPPLSSYVSIPDYSIKLVENASTFEAWHERSLVGLVAAYLNSPAGGFGFISNVSVLRECAGMGMASSLLRTCIRKAQDLKLHELRLEVASNNHSAIDLYRKLKFAEYERTTHLISMRLTLAGHTS